MDFPTVPAGFPSPADDFADVKLDLNEYLITHPAATFFVRVSGDSMIGAGIFDQDILIVDRSLEPRNRSVIIAVLDGEVLVKRLVMKRVMYDAKRLLIRGNIILLSENEKYPPIIVTKETDFTVWGVVTYVIHSCNV